MSPLPPRYVAPKPSEAQFLNAKAKKYDAWDLLGNITFVDLARDHVFAAAAVIHDECTLRQIETQEQREAYDNIFLENCLVLAEAVTTPLEKIYYPREAHLFWWIVHTVTEFGAYPQENRNTRETEIQGWQNQIVAQEYINQVALATGQKIPCPVPVMPEWSE